MSGTGPPEVLELRDVEISALGDRDLLIRVEAASVNRSDWEGRPSPEASFRSCFVASMHRAGTVSIRRTEDTPMENAASSWETLLIWITVAALVGASLAVAVSGRRRRLRGRENGLPSRPESGAESLRRQGDPGGML